MRVWLVAATAAILASCATAQQTVCETSVADITFVLDSSGSIRDSNVGTVDNWLLVLNFMNNIVDRLTVGPTDIRVGVVKYANRGNVEFLLNEFQTKDSLKNAISSIGYSGGNTNTSGGIWKMRTEVFDATFLDESRGDRRDVRNIAIVITDGKSTRDAEKSIPYANDAKRDGIRVLVVGVTPQVEESEIRDMSSTGVIGETYWLSSGFDVLQTIVESVVSETCRTIAPPQPTAPSACETSVSDLTFIVDSSGSIAENNPVGFDNWRDGVVNFISQITNLLQIGPTATQVALVTFANRGNLEWNLGELNDKSELIRRIDNLPYSGGNTNTSGGIYVALKQVYGSVANRPEARDVVIIITDGKSTRDQPLTIPYARELRQVATVFSIGITSLINETELREMSSLPQVERENYWKSPDFSTGLDEILQSLVQETCQTPRDACERADADVAILVDSSGSIRDNNPVGFDNWDDGIKGFLTNLVNRLNIGPANSLVSLATFANTGALQWDFRQNTDKASLLSAVGRLDYSGGNTNTSGGIWVIKDRLFGPGANGGERPDRRNILLIVTDGKSTRDERLTIPYANQMKQYATIFTVGITNLIDENELRLMSSDPQIEGQTYFKSPDFQALDNVLNTLLRQACQTLPPTPAPTTTRAPDPSGRCNNPVDLTLVVDSSGSIGEENFNRTRDHLIDVVEDLPVDTGLVRVALVQFSTDAAVRFRLDQFSTRAQIRNAIQQLRYDRGTTNTGAALRLVASEIYNSGRGDRENVPNVAVIFTDGGSNKKEDTINAALEAKTAFASRLRNIHFIPIGIGSWVDEAELDAIASHPYQQNRILIPNFRGLNADLRDRLRNLVCNNDNQCARNPCIRGECIDLVNGYLCRCPLGFSGPNCEYTCRDPRGDVVITLDSSGSIQKENFRRMVDFAKNVVYDIPMESGSRVALQTYGTTHKVIFQLNKHTDKLNVLNALTIPYYSAGTTNTAGALRNMYQDMFSSIRGDQPGVGNIGLLITDGRSNNYGETWSEAIAARSRGIHMMAVGIGNNVRQNELESIATGQAANVFRVDDFQSLNTIRTRLRDAVCNNQNECDSNPCLNGGECVEGIGYYTCNCPSTASGRNCERRCSPEADITFIVDRSGSIRNERFPFVKDYLSNIIDDLSVTSSQTRVAVVSFSDDARVEFNLRQYSSKQDVITAVKNIQWTGGRTNIASALEIARNSVFTVANGDRENVPNYVVVVSDGNSNIRQPETIPQAISTRIAGIHIATVSIGTDSNMMELRGMASYPESTNVYSVAGFQQLPTLRNPVIRNICDDVNECDSNPCQNGARCVDGLGMYRCICQNDFTGERCERTCRRQYDIAFLLDLSGSVDVAYNISIRFLRRVVYGLDLRFDRVRVSVTTFSDRATVRFRLNTYQGKDDVLNAVAFPDVGGRTNTQDGLRLLREEVFQDRNGDRFGVQNLVILLTDGGSNIVPSQTVQQATNLKNTGAQLYVVSIGNQVDMNEINGIASDPDSSFVYQIPTPAQVNERADALLTRLCQ